MENQERLKQNLEDAGCDSKLIKNFFELLSNNEMDKVFILLSKYRKELLNSLHKSQKEIDNLDYLILNLKKVKMEENKN